MRFLLALLLIAPAIAQTPAEQAKPEEKPAQQTAPAAAADQKTDAKTESPAPTAEQWLSGSIDFGYRWLTDIRGNLPEYRSVVNLGEGPKLLGADFAVQDPKKRLFDRLEGRAYGWGGDPYNTAHVGASKLGIYDFSFDYRNIAYFNYVPSFANPSAPGGFNERSFDVRRRNSAFTLDLLPGRRFTPYLAFERNSGSGHGIETWVQEANNEFAVPNTLRDSTENYRGGLRLEFNRFHATLEQGGTRFKEDDQAFNSGVNRGDRTTPVLGQPSLLYGLSQAYGIRGTSIYERALVTARPAGWVDVYGQFLFSQPKTDVRFNELAFGSFAQQSTLLLFNGQQTTALGTAIQPHSSGNVGIEVRPFRRLRIMQSLTVDHMHDTASPLATVLILPQNSLSSGLSYKQVVKYIQEETDVIVDLTAGMTLRGGFRHMRGDSSVLAGELSQAGDVVAGELNRNVGLAGFSFRPTGKLSINLDYEAAASDRVYFRTSLNDYHKARARVRYQPTAGLSVQANLMVLDNQNPSPDIRYDFRSRSNSLSVFWTPAGGKRISVMGQYDRSSLRSDIRYLALFLSPAISSYRDNAHSATSAIDFNLPGLPGAKITAGGSLFISSGSRPTRYYQPMGRVSLPLRKNVYWNTEWRWYGFGEQFYLYEAFRTHAFMTGIRVTR